MTLAARSTVRIPLRPVRASDAAAMQAYVTSMSAESRRLRFHGCLNGCTEALLQRLTDVDAERGIALVAVTRRDGVEVIVGEARYVLDETGRDAEFAISVTDGWQGRGVADRLMKALLRAARAAGVGALHGDVLDGNARMAAFMRRHGFAGVYDERVDSNALRWERDLSWLAMAAAAKRTIQALLRRLEPPAAAPAEERGRTPGCELALE